MIWQAAQEHDEEEEDEIEQITSVNLDDQIKAISMIGRVSLPTSLAALQERFSAVGKRLVMMLHHRWFHL